MALDPPAATLAAFVGTPVAGSILYDVRLFPVETIRNPPLAASPPLTGKGDPEIRVSVPSAFKRYPSVGSPLEESPFTKMNVPWAAAGVGVGVAPGGRGVGVGAGADAERTPPQPVRERINNKARAHVLPADTMVFIELSTRGSSSAG
jgi:hypothetical protein